MQNIENPMSETKKMVELAKYKKKKNYTLTQNANAKTSTGMRNVENSKNRTKK